MKTNKSKREVLLKRGGKKKINTLTSFELSDHVMASLNEIRGKEIENWVNGRKSVCLWVRCVWGVSVFCTMYTHTYTHTCRHTRTHNHLNKLSTSHVEKKKSVSE